MTTGIVIVNYNRGQLVHEIVHVFANYRNIDYIVIVDNFSTDDSRRILKAIGHEKIKCLFPERNEGYSRGNNIGLKWLREEKGCDYCFIVNPDVFFEEQVIRVVVDAFEQNPDYAIITTARIDPMASVPQIQYSTKVYDTFWLQFLSYFNLARHYYLLKKYGVYNYDTNDKRLRKIGVAPGSFFGIRMSSFLNGIVLDEGTFLYGEEDLLSMKCQQMNLKVGYLSSVVYEHRHIQHSTTLSKKSIMPIRHALKSKRYFQEKYLKLNFVQKGLLHLAERWSLVERYIIMCVK